MPLQSNIFFGEQQKALSLPGPALIIDVRPGMQDDLNLLHYLATELEDLTTEMQRGHVPQWRHLAECIDFLMLAPSDAGSALGISNGFTAFEPQMLAAGSYNNFIVGMRNRNIYHVSGKDQLTEYIGGKHINRLRNNRIHAIQDHDQQEAFAENEKYSPEQSTVRVFFLVDLKEQASFALAAQVAIWLKEWDIKDAGKTRSGRAERIEVVAICMNAGQHHYDLFSETEPLAALNTIILLHTYSDDDGHIDEQAQVHQVELILYTLLLHWPDCFEREFEDTLESGADLTHHLTIPTYLIGISAFEYSGRWGARWLNYGLAAGLIEALHAQQKMPQEELVSAWFERLYEGAQSLVRGGIQRLFPRLNVLEQLQKLVGSPAIRRGSPASLLQDLRLFCQQISEIYISDSLKSTNDVSLDKVLKSATFIVSQLKLPDTYDSEKKVHLNESEKKVYVKWQELQARARDFSLELFLEGQGALPRALSQIAALKRSIQLVGQQASPDIVALHKKFQQEAAEAQLQLERLTKLRRWPLLGRSSLRREVQAIYKPVCDLVLKHIDYVQKALAYQMVLALLESVGLYEATGQPGSCQLLLTDLDKCLTIARGKAIRQHDLAKERLQFGLDERQGFSTHRQARYHLSNRHEILEWREIQDAFLRSSQEIRSGSPPFKDLAFMLLDVARKPPSFSNGRQKLPRRGEVSDEERFQLLQIRLVASSLLANSKHVDHSNIYSLLNEYAHLAQRIHVGPSLLNSDVLDIGNAIKEAILAQMSGSMHGDVLERFAFTPEMVLAAWVENQQMSDPKLSKVIDNRSVLEHIKERRQKFSQVLEELFNRNKLIGYPDQTTGDDYRYLFYPQGDQSTLLLQALKDMPKISLQALPFPDTEKLIYLHVHRLRQV